MGAQDKKKPESTGKCSLCGETFDKKKMTKHLTSCIKEKSGDEDSSAKKKLKKGMIFHLVVEGRGQPEYWIHIAAPAQAKLIHLDSFLRDIWVECCGHLSAFNIGGVSYSGGASGADFLGQDFEDDMDESMDITLEKVLSPQIKFLYEYDFGTTTELTLKVVSVYEGHVKGEEIQLLARNDSPVIMCDSCGKVAVQICTECVYNGEGWLCDVCALKHECGEEVCLPVVNSPRVGMCGYSG
ncbi:MAG: hypothetical protein HW390_1203 [Candidatus Brocadiaceae bacterium]|nr:hypothetical protein [Candidatus Brocadiaceae bacterium]